MNSIADRYDLWTREELIEYIQVLSGVLHKKDEIRIIYFKGGNE